MIHNKYFEIMKQFLKDYDQEIYGRELIGKINISQKNIALTLNSLEKHGILSSKIKGNSKYFFLNRKNPLIKEYILLTEIENTLLFFKNNIKISQVFDKIDKKNKIMCIFGSYAKGIQKKDSDLDLLIIGKTDENEIKKIGELFNIKISIKKGSLNDFKELLEKNNPLMNEILENHIIISGYEEFIYEVIKKKW